VPISIVRRPGDGLEMASAPFIMLAMIEIATGPKIGARRRVVTGWKALAGVAVATLALAGAVNAIDDAALSIDAIEGDGWSAHGVVVSFELPRQKTSARVNVARLRLASLPEELRDVRIDCPQVELAEATFACKRAHVVAKWPGIGAQSLNASIVYGRGDGALDVAIDGLALGQGRANMQGALRNGGWSGKLQMQRVPIELLLKIAQDLRLPMPSLSGSGRVTLSASARGAGSNLRAAAADITFIDVTANNESGSLASDKLSVRLQGSLQRRAGALQFAMEVQSRGGQAYAQPIFLDFTAHALKASAQGTLRDAHELNIERFAVDHSGVTQASGRARIDLDHEQPLRALQLALAKLQFPGAYESYLQPLLLDTNFKSMQTAGGIAGSVVVEQGVPRSIDLQLDDITVDDGAQNLALSQLQGHWHWRADGAADTEDEESATSAGPAPQSLLRWSGGTLFGLALGASELQFATHGRQFRLLQPTRIPLLDGAIDLESFRVRNAGTPKVAFMVDATIRPISVQRLCKSFGWPEFGGSIGGVISKLRMREGVVTLGTTLRAQVFNGDVTIKDLRLEQPFGTWPRFYSSIALDNLDLEPVTSAFSFGRITGRLSGTIDGLQLFNWTPVAFDARLYTPATDRSKHRISQRAVENIGSIGGGGSGVTAALSSGFLRFFDDFNYDRLGLSCRLQNEVCVMNGVAPAPNGGYYLVKGQGLPRIDVIGSARRVDWPRLVQQLIAVTESEGPVVN
jgi:hypothetical protein